MACNLPTGHSYRPSRRLEDMHIGLDYRYSPQPFLELTDEKRMLSFQAHKFGQSQIFCVVEVGGREVDRTRQVKLSTDVVWEAPEERFRVAVEDIEGAKPPPEERNDFARAGTLSSAESVGMAAKPIGGPTTRSDREEKEAWETGEGPDSARAIDTAVAAVNNNAPPVSVLSIPLEQHDQRSQRQHQRVAGASSSLMISVWSKGAMLGGRQGLLLGNAIVPARYIDHPPGDAWLPLVGSGETTAATTTGDGTQDRKVQYKGRDGRRSGNIEDVTSLGESPGHHLTPSAAADGDATSIEEKSRGGKKPWGSRFFKKGNVRKTGMGGVESAQEKGATAGSVHIWLGKVRRGSSSSQQPGKGQAVLRVHAASGLRKVIRL